MQIERTHVRHFPDDDRQHTESHYDLQIGMVTAQLIQKSLILELFRLENIPVLQPEKLKDEAFLDELRSYHADLQIVVAFRMLPVVVWEMPHMGTFNLHASLLPQYRGAAPIHWAVMNG